MSTLYLEAGIVFTLPLVVAAISSTIMWRSLGKPWLFFVACMRTVLFALTVVVLPACAGDHALQDRAAYWRGALSQGVPTGSSKQKAMEWASGHNVRFTYLNQKNWLYANVEQVPESGIPFPCSHWNIILKVAFDGTGHSLSNEVSTVGICL